MSVIIPTLNGGVQSEKEKRSNIEKLGSYQGKLWNLCELGNSSELRNSRELENSRKVKRIWELKDI